jgi:hypothetical protein
MGTSTYPQPGVGQPGLITASAVALGGGHPGLHKGGSAPGAGLHSDPRVMPHPRGCAGFHVAHISGNPEKMTFCPRVQCTVTCAVVFNVRNWLGLVQSGLRIGPNGPWRLTARCRRMAMHTKTGLWGHFLNGVTFDWEIFWTSGLV